MVLNIRYMIMATENRKLLNKRDLITIITILLSGIVTFAVLTLISSDDTKAVISVNGKVISEHSLDSSVRNNHSEFTIAEAEGAVIEIENGQIRVKSSDCPDKVCVNTGYISKEGEKIVCLPKKLIIEIEPD